MWFSAALGLSLWQAVVGVVVAVRTEPPLALLLCHGLLASGGVLIGLGRAHRTRWRLAFFAALAPLLGADLAVAVDDPASSAIVCTSFVVVATALLVLEPLLGFPLVLLGAGGAAVAAREAGHGADTLAAVAMPVLLYAAAAAIVRAILMRQAAEADAVSRARHRAHRRLVRARAAADAAAEHLRLLHDTFVNTLGAIAGGGRSTLDVAAVRRRCRDDVDHLRASLSPQAAGDERAGFDGVGDGLGLRIDWSGVEQGRRAELIAALPRHRADALRGAVRELLLNVTKHTPASSARISVEELPERLVVSVEDDGPGIAEDAAIGTGLRRSVGHRAAGAGIDVSLESRPGEGTCVRLDVPRGVSSPRRPGLPGRAGSAGPVHDDGDRILRRGAWAWSLAVAASSALIGIAGNGGVATVAGSTLVVLCVVAAVAACWPGRPLPTPLAWAMALVAPGAWLLLHDGATAPGSRPEFWQVLGVAPVLVLLLTTGRSPAPAVVAVALVLGAGVDTAVRLWADDPGSGALALSGTAVGLCQMVVWVLFTALLGAVTDYTVAARAERARDEVEQTALETAEATRRRWREARVQAAADLLERIADGRLDPADPQVRRRAAAEEHSLRQLLMLGPHHRNLAPWVARSLAVSRDRGVRLTVRLGDADLAASAAEAAGTALVTIASAVPPGTEMVFAHLPLGDADAPTVVLPARAFDPAAHRPAIDAASCTLTLRRVGEQDLFTMHAARPPAR